MPQLTKDELERDQANTDEPYVLQWWWSKDHGNNWVKNNYHGPKLGSTHLIDEKVDPPKDA